MISGMICISKGCQSLTPRVVCPGLFDGAEAGEVCGGPPFIEGVFCPLEVGVPLPFTWGLEGCPLSGGGGGGGGGCGT